MLLQITKKLSLYIGKMKGKMCKKNGKLTSWQLPCGSSVIQKPCKNSVFLSLCYYSVSLHLWCFVCLFVCLIIYFSFLPWVFWNSCCWVEGKIRFRREFLFSDRSCETFQQPVKLGEASFLGRTVLGAATGGSASLLNCWIFFPWRKNQKHVLEAWQVGQHPASQYQLLPSHPSRQWHPEHFTLPWPGHLIGERDRLKFALSFLSLSAQVTPLSSSDVNPQVLSLKKIK